MGRRAGGVTRAGEWWHWERGKTERSAVRGGSDGLCGFGEDEPRQDAEVHYCMGCMEVRHMGRNISEWTRWRGDGAGSEYGQRMDDDNAWLARVRRSRQLADDMVTTRKRGAGRTLCTRPAAIQRVGEWRVIQSRAEVGRIDEKRGAGDRYFTAMTARGPREKESI
ncbi:hypothetical protein BV20DRAFT_800119 [Pilatotrama ljubarskyi]|nr:hypothetical protein BV20DRAFT_800119 [Pilatotrama ljubarskyi]